MTVAGRRSRDRPGPDQAPRNDSLDVRWSPDYQTIVTSVPDKLRPTISSALWRLLSQTWDQGAREHAAGIPNPWWRENPDIAGRDDDFTPRPRGNIMAATPLVVDAKNRALRTFLVGLSIDVLVAVVTVLVTVFATAGGWGDLQWAVIGFTLAKTVAATIGSYILRRFVDRSRIPTPLPPAPVPAPADPAGDDVVEEYNPRHNID